MKKSYLWILHLIIILLNYSVIAADEDEEGEHKAPSISKGVKIHSNHIDDTPHKSVYYLSNPWAITVAMVVGIVVLFNILMIFYVQCSIGCRRPWIFGKNARKGYKNVAIDSEDLSNSEMEQINIGCK